MINVHLRKKVLSHKTRLIAKRGESKRNINPVPYGYNFDGTIRQSPGEIKGGFVLPEPIDLDPFENI